MWKKYLGQNGITLISLVITVIVLITLGAITLSILLGQDGLINKAMKSKEATEAGNIKEQIILKLVDKLDTDISEKDIEEIFNQYGEVGYDDRGRVKELILGNGFKIAVSDVWKGKITPWINEAENIDYILKIMATQSTTEIKEESQSLEYKVEKLGYRVERVWFYDTATAKFSIKYGGQSSSEKTSNFNIEKVIQSGTLKIDLSGEINDSDEYSINWDNKIQKRFILKNTGNLVLKYRISLTADDTLGTNLAKYIKVLVKDKDGQEYEDINQIERELAVGEETYYDLILALEE